jgi:hypothetical protein
LRSTVVLVPPALVVVVVVVVVIDSFLCAVSCHPDASCCDFDCVEKKSVMKTDAVMMLSAPCGTLESAAQMVA